MKKILKYLFIIPILLIAMGCLFACDENGVSSVSLSITNDGIICDGGEYYIEYPSQPIKVDATITPSKYSAKNITWTSTATNVAYINSNGYLVTSGVGTTTLGAKYVNEDGTTIYSPTVKLHVSRDSLPTFANTNVNTDYVGADIKDNYLISNGNDSIYSYEYYNLSTKTEVDEIIDAGRYQISYVKTSSGAKYAEMYLTVNKHQITMTAQSCTSVFSKATPAGFYTSAPLESDFEDSSAYEITAGVGVDSDEILGKYLYRTNATRTSNAGTYATTIEYRLEEEYEKNYTVFIVPGTHIVTAREVVLAVENQEVVYSDNLESNKFKLYDYNDYLENGSVISVALSSLGNSEINYSSNVSAEAYSYKKDGESVSVNAYGYLDVGLYELTYATTSLSTSKNLVIMGNIQPGTLTVSKREVTITPRANSKVYGEEDDNESLAYDYSGVIAVRSEIQPFLAVDYGETDYGNRNFKAPVGTYYYEIDNSVNTNYNLVLSQRAGSAWENAEERIKFEVEKCPIVVQFANKTAYYKNSSGVLVPTVSYYSLTPTSDIPNYIIDEIASLKINGVEQVSDNVCACKDSDFESLGYFILCTDETFRIPIQLEKLTGQSEHFAVYSVVLQESSLAEGDNYIISVLTSYLYVDKITITITPNETPNISSKVYNVNSEISNSFFADYTASGNFESGIEVSDIIRRDPLSLVNAQGNYVLKKGSNYTYLDTINNCGTYKIFLTSNLEYLTGMEYYTFVLNNAREYFYTITKATVTIIPDSNQSKIYGDPDGDITYTNSELSETITPTGELSRVSGEDCSTYAITIGSVSFGDNYNVVIDPDTKFYTIIKREIDIEPYSLVTTYGDSSSRINYHNPFATETYDENILVKPTFTGEFALYYDDVLQEKVGGYYPVKEVSGEVKSYTIKQGSFACQSNNYTINVIETATYKVLKKSTTLNITAQNRTSSDGLSNNFTSFTSYDLSNKVGTPVLSGLTFTATSTDDVYYIAAKADITNFQVTLSGVEVTSSYDWSLGQNIVYYIASEVIDLSIVSADNVNTSMVEQVYSGADVTDKFRLVCTTPGYSIDEETSTFGLSYSTTASSNVVPNSAGSYYVSLDIGSEKTVVINKSNGTSIQFTSLDVKTQNCVINLSQYGYLNIARADISYVQTGLGFNGNLVYGNDETTLGLLRTTYMDGDTEANVFYGVNDEVISLQTYSDGKNYVYVTAPQSIETLNASSSSYMVTVTVRAVDGSNNVDTNYNSLNVDVPLFVSPRGITIESNSAVLNSSSYTEDGNENDETIRYTGRACYFTLTMTTDPVEENYTKSYEYIKLESIYDGSAVATVNTYNYSSGVISSTAEPKDIQNLASPKTARIINNNGVDYYLIDESEATPYCIKIQTQNVVSRDAGIYLCRATATATSNYNFDNGGTGVYSTSFYKFFEIEKSDSIQISDWKDEFYVGTIFNLNDQSSLPFSYRMTPDFKNKVVYSSETEEAWEALGYELQVSSNNYEILLTINENNYFLESTQTFKVVSCVAEIVFPEIDTYVYIEDNHPIDSFKSDIKAILKDSNGVDTSIVTYSVGTDFVFSYKNADTDVSYGDTAPWDVGNYILTVTYGTETSEHYGTGEWEYSITKKAYAGRVIVQAETIEYDPTYTSTTLYNLIRYGPNGIGGMFTMEDSTVEYTLVITYSALGLVISRDTTDWLDTINVADAKDLTFTASFEDDKIKDYVGTARLTIAKHIIEDSDFTVPSNNVSYVYNGYIQYNELKYLSTVSLIPGVSGSLPVAYTIGTNIFHVTTVSTDATNEKKVTLTDKLGKTLFSLTYKYEAYNATSNEYENAGFPIIPRTTNYKVTYIFSGFGDDYASQSGTVLMNTINTTSIEFSIIKADSLYISTSAQVFIEDYDGTNFLDTFDLTNNINVSNSHDVVSNMKTSFSTNVLPSQNPTYTTSDGVRLVTQYRNSVGEFVTEMKNAGVYQISVTLLCNTNYIITDYFNNVVFGGTSYPTAEYFNGVGCCMTGNTSVYATCLTISCTINKLDCPYSLEENNMEEVLTDITPAIETAYDATNTLYFKAYTTTTYTVDTSHGYSVVILRNNLGTFEELDASTTFADLNVGEEYKLQFKALETNINYKDSLYIALIVYKVDCPYDISNLTEIMTGLVYETITSGDDEYIQVTQSATYTLNTSCEYSLKMYTLSGGVYLEVTDFTTFSALPIGMYYMRFEGSPLYEDSAYIACEVVTS